MYLDAALLTVLSRSADVSSLSVPAPPPTPFPEPLHCHQHQNLAQRRTARGWTWLPRSLGVHDTYRAPCRPRRLRQRPGHRPLPIPPPQVRPPPTSPRQHNQMPTSSRIPGQDGCCFLRALGPRALLRLELVASTRPPCCHQLTAPAAKHEVNLRVEKTNDQAVVMRHTVGSTWMSCVQRCPARTIPGNLRENSCTLCHDRPL